jgi:hypothetical protein
LETEVSALKRPKIRCLNFRHVTFPLTFAGFVYYRSFRHGHWHFTIAYRETDFQRAGIEEEEEEEEEEDRFSIKWVCRNSERQSWPQQKLF